MPKRFHDISVASPEHDLESESQEIALALTSTIVTMPAWGQDWKAQVKEFRIGLLGGENTQDRLKRYDAF